MGLDLGPWKDAIITIATDDDLTPEVNLGGEFEHLLVLIPTLTAATVSVQCSRISGGTFVTVASLNPTATGHFTQITTAGTGGIEAVFDIHFCQYIKIATGAGQAANRTFQVRGFGLGG